MSTHTTDQVEGKQDHMALEGGEVSEIHEQIYNQAVVQQSQDSANNVVLTSNTNGAHHQVSGQAGAHHPHDSNNGRIGAPSGSISQLRFVVFPNEVASLSGRSQSGQDTQGAALVSEHKSKVKVSAFRRDKEVKKLEEQHLVRVKGFDDELERALAKAGLILKTNGEKSLGANDSGYDTLSAASTNGSFSDSCGSLSTSTSIPRPSPYDSFPRNHPSTGSTQYTSGSFIGSPVINADSRSLATYSPFSLKRKATESAPVPPSAKKAREAPASIPTPAPSTSPTFVETVPIRPQLMGFPFCFVSAWHVDVDDENLRKMRRMCAAARFYPGIRIDATGYFYVFEPSEKGDEYAANCAAHFQRHSFGHHKLHMEFVARGHALDKHK